jgi:hypothetical protein
MLPVERENPFQDRNVYGPGEEPPQDGKEPFFQRGGLLALIILIITLVGVAYLKVWYNDATRDWFKSLF